MKITPVPKSNLDYNRLKKKSEYPKNKKYRCPKCNQIINFNDLIEVFNIDDKEEQAIIQQKMIEKGYEFGSR